ncbi:hypothetical protein NBO_364g0008 [Nosema bombycis CQ1]|uniref:Uncharacterized protein n=1 Tax=Nosema bombycis (strain CQ1 / CVCC 102059) TaxID=578461 RepID=R0KRG5_NOSB1|nr:hypothetical protein NBO_364g0008 [Nosema bombycis CQ1]|eukprot:EOB12802.1 hypothetical protein NBO_364g0008 [Nosema bombycis CQ1]
MFLMIVMKESKNFKKILNLFSIQKTLLPRKPFQNIMTNLECNPLQNDITPFRNGSDGEDQNLINEQSELHNDENQNNNNDHTNEETKLEKTSDSLENNISKDETKEARTEISNTANLNTDNENKQENGQEFEVTDKINYNESKDLQDDDRENIKILHNNEQISKDSSNQTNNKINSA